MQYKIILLLYFLKIQIELGYIFTIYTVKGTILAFLLI